MDLTLSREVKEIGLYACAYFRNIDINTYSAHVYDYTLKDLNSTVAKRGSVFIGLMTPNGAIWFRYQRAVLMR